MQYKQAAGKHQGLPTLSFMKQLLYIIPYNQLFPPKNGGMLRNYFLCYELSKYYSVTLVTFQEAGSFKNGSDGYFWNEEIRVITIPVPATKPVGFKKIVNAIKGRFYQWRFFSSVNNYALYGHPVIKNLLKKTNYHFIIMPHLGTLRLMHLIHRYGGKSTKIFDAHNVDHLLFAGGNDLSIATNSKRYEQIRREEKSLHTKVDLFLACSETDRQIVEEINRSKIKGLVVPNGADTYHNQFMIQKDTSIKQILFCGSLDYQPNIDGIVWFYQDIWPFLQKMVPGIRLVVIGRNGNRPEYEELKKDESIDFIGEVLQVKEYYMQTSVSIVPLRSGSGTRLKILEAMCLGNPVVSTTIGAEGIECTNGVNIMLADEAEMFASAVAGLLMQTEKAELLRINARRLIDEKYSWEIVGKKLANALGE